MLWASWGTFGQFYSYFLSDNGYSSSQIGIALTSFMVAGLIGLYAWGRLCDYKRIIKPIYRLMVIMAAIGAILFSVFVEYPIAIYVINGTIGFSWMAREAIIDSWAMGSRGIKKESYGYMRMGGSLGFALMCAFFGKLLDVYGWDLMIYAFVVMSGIDVVFISLTKDTYDGKVSHKIINKKGAHISELLTNKPYMILLLFVFLVGVAKFMILNFYPFVIKNVGGNQVHLGLAAALAAFVEIPVFLISSKVIKKYNPRVIFLIAAVFYFIRTFMDFVATEPYLIIGAAAFQAMGFGLILSMARQYITRIAPVNLTTTAQTLFSASYFGLSGIVSSLLGGYIIDHQGMTAFYIVSLIFVGLAILLMLYINIFNKKLFNIETSGN
jgi:PPP family 3-phenylpropionic acid transporter